MRIDGGLTPETNSLYVQTYWAHSDCCYNLAIWYIDSNKPKINKTPNRISYPRILNLTVIRVTNRSILRKSLKCLKHHRSQDRYTPRVGASAVKGPSLSSPCLWHCCCRTQNRLAPLVLVCWSCKRSLHHPPPETRSKGNHTLCSTSARLLILLQHQVRLWKCCVKKQICYIIVCGLIFHTG